MTGQGEKLYRMREACEILGIHPNTLRRWEKEGKIRVIRPPGGYRRIPTNEVNRILEGRSAPSLKPDQIPEPAGNLIGFLNYVFTHHKNDWNLVKRAILIRDSHTCQKCGSKLNLDVYHRDGTVRNDPDNLQTLCRNCTIKTGKKTEKQEKEPDKPPVPKKEPPKPPPPAPQRPVQVAKPPQPKPKLEPGPIQKLQRHEIIDKLSPESLVKRTAFGDLLSAAAALETFMPAQLAERANCPQALALEFCDKMKKNSFMVSSSGGLKLRVEVAR